MHIREPRQAIPGDDRDHTLLLLCDALGLPRARTLPALQRARSGADETAAQLLRAVLARQLELPGAGPVALMRLAAALKLAEALAAEALLQAPTIDSPEACLSWLRLHLARRVNECFVGIYLDAGHRVLALEDLFYGTVDSAAVHPRVVAERALALGAAAVIVAHNHPSGRLEPSAADARITERLRAGLALLDIRLLDHLIIGGGAHTSLSQRGLC